MSGMTHWRHIGVAAVGTIMLAALLARSLDRQRCEPALSLPPCDITDAISPPAPLWLIPLIGGLAVLAAFVLARMTRRP